MMICLHILFLSLSMVLQQQEAPSLDSVLKKMDAAAATFQATQADFVWEQYQRVVDETDTQTGSGLLPQGGQRQRCRNDGRHQAA